MQRLTRIMVRWAAVTALVCTSCNPVQKDKEPAGPWSIEKARKWANEKGWLTGANFTPSTAINQLEFWQAETFDPETIDRELSLAESIGFNTVRSYLHHLAWQLDPKGFLERIDQFLAIAARYDIEPVLVIFDDCWNPTYSAGKQPDPKPGVHNSGWLRDPGELLYTDTTLMALLKEYTISLMSHFADDDRILMWDLYNEPGNSGYGMKSMPLLQNVFSWARSVNPSQPVSVGLWYRNFEEMNRFQAENSDIITYHNYSDEKDHAAALDTLKSFGKPMICTEYMARNNGSRFDNILPLLKSEGIGAINWGLVSGKTNTIYAWNTPIPDGSEPPVWFHDIFRKDGTPYDPSETDLISRLNRTISRNDVTAFWNRPAAGWHEAIPIGNGLLGAMVYGGVTSDTIKLNEATLWSGEPADKQNYTAHQYLSRIRQLLMEDKTKEAERLIDSTMLGPYNECYLPMGDLVLKWNPAGKASDYRRELNMSEGLVRVNYQIDNHSVKREIFASSPDQVIAIKLSGDKNGTISFNAGLTSLLNHTVTIKGNELVLDGQAPLHAYPHYLGRLEPVYADGHGMKFQVRMIVRLKGGSVKEMNGQLSISKADEVEILLTGTTSYNGFDKDPYSEGKDCNDICVKRMERIRDVSFNDLRSRHIRDFSGLFGRVGLNLGNSPADHLPTDVRIENYQPDRDPGLTALYYQFGRYLLISCSQPGCQPANLQGIWSNSLQPAWSANWTLNCNAQINYWPVEQGNLSECHLPLIQMTKELSVDGARTAKIMYNARGWIAHHNADIWRQTSPVGGTGLWAIYQVGGAWLCHHVWEHYEYTLDQDYLRDVYPLLKGASQFYLDNLQQDADGYWVTSPAESFENQFRKPDGTVGWACMGPTQDMQIIRDLFINTMKAATTMKMDKKFSREVGKKLEKLLPMRISPTTGQLQEWKDDWEAADPHSGQVAHGWGLAVGNQISPRETPELAAAFRRTIEFRKPWESYNAGSWVGSFPARFWVRLYDGAMAQTVLDRHFKLAIFPNLTSKFFDAFWEIDGNLGITAAIGEMLLQSHTGEIALLPGLSPKYPDGEVKGLCARGGFEVDIKWGAGLLAEAKISSKFNAACRLRYGDLTRNIRMKAGETVTVDAKLD